MRKQPRTLAVTLPEKSDFHLRTEEGSFPVRDLGAGGLGVWLPKDRLHAWSPGREVEAELRHAGKTHVVRLLVRHRGMRLAGFCFHNLAGDLAKQLETWLEPARLASQLEVLVGAPATDPVSGYNRLWLANADGDAQLLFWFNGSPPLAAGILAAYGDRWIFRERGKPVITGKFDRGARWDGAFGPPPPHQKEGKPASANVVAEAARFLLSAPAPVPGRALWHFLESGEPTHLVITFPPYKAA